MEIEHFCNLILIHMPHYYSWFLAITGQKLGGENVEI